MKALSPVLPEHAAAPCLCDADPEYQIFIVLFTGRSRCVRVRASWWFQKLAELVSKVSEVPAQNFYLTCDGTTLEEHDNLRRVSPNCRVLMHGRLVGGARTTIPGEWSCAVCGAQGCWPTRRLLQMRFNEHCFSSTIGSVYQWIQGAFQGADWYGAPFTSRCPCSGTCPGGGATQTYQKSKKAAEQRNAVPPSQVPAGQSKWDTVLQALFNIGLDESVLGKIIEKIPTPPPVEKEKERHLADLRDKRDKFREFWIACSRMLKRKR